MVCPTQWTRLEAALHQEMLHCSSSRQGGLAEAETEQGKQTVKRKRSLRRERIRSQAPEVLQGDTRARDPWRLGTV